MKWAKRLQRLELLKLKTKKFNIRKVKFQYMMQVLIKKQYLTRIFFGRKGFKYFIGYEDNEEVCFYI